MGTTPFTISHVAPRSGKHLIITTTYGPLSLELPTTFKLLRIIGDTSRAIFFQFVLLKKQRTFFHKKESKYLIRISVCLVVLELWPKICKSENFRHFPHPR